MICTAPTTSASPKYICIPQKNQVLIQPQQQKQAEYLHISSASPQIIRTVSVPSGGAGNVQLGVNPTSNVVQGPSLFRTALVSVSFILHVFEQNCFNRSMMIIQSVSKAAGVPFVGRSNGNVIQLASAAASPRYRWWCSTKTNPNVLLIFLATHIERSHSIFFLSTKIQWWMIHVIDICHVSPVYSLIPIDHVTKSPQNPIVPLTSSAQLIPFKSASETVDPKSVSLFSPARGSPSGVTNFDRIQQQIQRRAQLLETYRRLAKTQLKSENRSPIKKPNSSQLPIFSSTIARSSSPKGSGINEFQLTRPSFLDTKKTKSKKSSSSSSSSTSSSSSSSSSAKPQPSIQTAYSRPYSVISNAGSRASQPTNNYGQL